MGIVERMRDERWLAIPTMDVVVMVRTAADLIERLRGYAQHGKRSDGEACSAAWVKGAECDCGLSALIKEIEGD